MVERSRMEVGYVERRLGLRESSARLWWILFAYLAVRTLPQYEPQPEGLYGVGYAGAMRTRSLGADFPLLPWRVPVA